MATYGEFCLVAERVGGNRVGEDAWQFDVPGVEDGRLQRVFAFREVISPDLELIRISSAFAIIGTVDPDLVLRQYGSLSIGSIGYSPNFDDAGNAVEGFLTLSTSLPLLALDLTDPLALGLPLHVLGRAADNIEFQLSSTDEF